MFDEQDRQYFYNEFKNNGYEVGSYDDFKKDLNNKEDRDWYYNEAKNMGYDVGTQADFDKMVLEPAPSTSGGGKQVDTSATTQSVGQKASTETKPQVAQPAKKQETTDKEPGLIAKALGMIPTGVQTSNGTYQPSPAISQPVVKGEEKPVKEETSPSSSANAAPVTTPTGVVNNEGLMDAKLANYIENWKLRPDKQSSYFENMVADLLADGTANSNEEAVNMVMPALHRYAYRSAMDVTNKVVSSLPDDTVQDAEQSIGTQWYSHGVQDKLKQEADSMGISYDDYVAHFLKPAMVQSLVNKYGPNYRNIAEGIATRLYAHDENVQDRLMNQDINDALSDVIRKYTSTSVVKAIQDAEAASNAQMAKYNEQSKYVDAASPFAIGAIAEANKTRDPQKILIGLQQKFGKLYRNPEFLNDMSNAAFKVMQRYGLNGGLTGDPKQFKPMINAAIKNELDQLEVKGMIPRGSADYILKTGIENTIIGKVSRKIMQTDYQNWLEDIANQQYQPGFWENVASGALTFAGDAWSYWLPGAAGGKLTKSMVAKAEGKLAGDLMAKGMERRVAERAAKVLIGKSKDVALKNGAVHGAVTFGGQSAISKPIDEIYRTGQFDENGKVYNPSVGKILANTLGEVVKQSAVGAIMQGGTIANMVGKGRGLATNILADVGGKVVDSSIMTGQQMLERMAQDPSFKPTGKDAAESFLESMANLTSIGLPGMVGKYARFKDAKEFNRKFDFNDQDIAELKRFGYDDLRDAFEKLGINGYRVDGEGVQMMGQLTDKYMNLMNDKSVPEVLKAKMMAVVEGKRPSSFSPVVDSIILQPMDNNGKVYLEILNKDGGVVDRKEYSSLDEAQKADKKLEYEKTLGLASVLEGEFHNEFTQEHLEGLYNKAAQKYNMGEKLTDEDKAAVYLHQNAGAIKEIMNKQQKGVILTDEEQKQVDAYRHYYDSALENSSVMREFVNTFEDSHGVARGTLRKALESKDKKYAPLVESYLKELYNSIELKREMKQTMDDLYNTSHGNEQKRIEQSGVEGEKPATPVEGSVGGQEPPVSSGLAPYQDRTNSVPSPSDANSAANLANSSAEVPPTEPPTPPVEGEKPSNESKPDAYVMGQNAYQNGDAEGLKAIDHNDDVSKARLKRAFADDEAQMNVVVKAYEDGKDMEQFVAQRSGYMTPAQQDAVRKYVEAQDAKNGVYDALQHADDGYAESLKQQLSPYTMENGNIFSLTLTDGQRGYWKSKNDYGAGFGVFPDANGKPVVKQVSLSQVKEEGKEIPLQEYVNQLAAQKHEATKKNFEAMFDATSLKPNDTVSLSINDKDQPTEAKIVSVNPDGTISFNIAGSKNITTVPVEQFNKFQHFAQRNGINAELDAEDAQRAENEAIKAEAEKKQRFANGIVGLSDQKPDYSSKETDTKVAAEYLQEQYGEDHGKLLNLVNGSRDDIKTQLANKRKAAAEYQNWLDTNADLDPEKAKKVEDELSLVNEQIADLDARFKNWNTIRNSVMTPDEVKAMTKERKAEVEKAGVDETAIVPSDDFHVLVLDDKELKKQYPTMDEATDYITSQRKDIYHTQEDVERKINGVNDMLDQYINGETELDPTQLMELNTTKAQLEALQTNLSVAAKGLKAQANKLSKLYKTEVSQQEMEELGMTPSEQRKVLVSDAIKKNDLGAIIKIYKDASVDVTDLTPQALEEAVSEYLRPHSLNPESLQYELGKSNFKFGIGKRYDSNKFNYLIAKKGTGMSVNEFAVRVYNNLPVNLQDMGYTDQDVRNTLLDMFKSYDSVKEIKNVALMNRIAAAEDELASEEEYYEAQKEREIIEKQAEIEKYKSYIHEKELSLPSESELDHIYGLEYDRMMEIEDREREYKQYVKSILPELADYDDRSNEEGYGGGSSLGSDSSRRGVDEGNSQGEEVGNGEASSESEIGEGSDSGRKGRQETGSMEPGEGSAVRGSHLPQEASFGERLKSAIAETETEPTEAQKKAGNYKKGHLSFGGYDFTVETPKGVTRSGKDEQGKPWSVTMHDTYGYILGKIGVDGDHIDMFINDAADLDTFDGNVYVVDQVNPETGEFDEHKVMYGYPSEEAATEAYLANYSKGWKGLGKVTSVTKATFDKWLESSDRKTKPFAEYAMVQKEQAKFDRDVKEVKPSEMTEAQKVAYDAVSTMLKKAGIPVKVVSNEDMEKVAEAQDNLNLAMLLNHPEMRFKIKTPEEKKAAENAYNFAKELRPDKWKQYAVVDMSNPNKAPEYFEKQELARKERSYYNKLMWGNYKVFNLDKSFEDNVAGLTGSFPSEFDPYKIDEQTNKRNELKKQMKETEEAYKLTGQERVKYQNQLMKEYMDEHGLDSENDIPDDVWNDCRNKSFEKYQDKLDSLFAKYKDLDRQLKSVAEPGVQYLKGKGVVYGYTDGKEIVLNLEHLNPNTPIHEYQHLWRTAAKNMNPELIEHGDKLIMQTQLFTDLKQDPNYNHLTDEQICDEAFARLTGEDGAAILEQMAKDAIKENPLDTAKELTIINRLKDWLKKFWYWTLDTFTKWKPEDIKRMTLEDIRNLVLRDLAQGVDPRTVLNEKKAKKAEDNKTMFGMHNISVDKLRKAIKQGGFAAPSMGVIDSKNGIYSGYGEITLIPKAEKIAKRTGKNIGTYAADAWTPIYPPVEKKFGGNGGDVAYDDIESVPKEMQNVTRNAINSFMDGRDTNSLAYLYLHEKGKAPELVHVEGKYPKELHDEVKGILGKSNGIYNTTDEQKEKLLDLFIREVYDGNREEFDNDIKKIIKKDEEFIKKRPNSNIAKNKQLDVDWMKEHGYDYGALSRFVDGILRDAETSGKVDENATMKAAQQYIQDKGMKEDFDSWKEKLNDRYQVEEVIFAGYKADGNRKYLPNTVENAVKVMKQDGKNASVGSASFSHFVASILKPMGTLDQIRKKKGNLTGNYEDVEKFQEKWQPVYDELADKMQPGAGAFESYGMDRLEEAATQKNPKKYAKEEYGVDLTDEDINKLNELIEAVKNDKPSIYFETKFMRPYGLDEFEKAIVPKGTPKDVIDALKKAGIDVHTYEGKEDREKVTMDAINNSEGIRFFLQDLDTEYLDAVKKGDMEKAQKLVNEAAEAAGYSTDSSYQGTSAFNGSAPWGNGYFLTKEERKEAWDNGEFEGESTLGDYINDDIDGGNLEELTNAASYRAADPMRKEAIDNVRNAIQKKSKTITMYRSVPSDVKEGSFRNGDWVTPSRAYAVDNAKLHGWGDDYNIIEQKVPVGDVWFDGNDIAEWGYGLEKDYINDTDFAYKNTKNNRKLLDAVTYDDNGEVIPLSQRFDPSKKDIRFHRVTDPKEIERLNKEKTFRMFSAMQDYKGELYSPMAAIIDGKRTDPARIGEWNKSDERPDLVNDDGTFTLVKTDERGGKKNGMGDVDANYAPYMHTSSSMMNDQFTGAYARGNIRVVEWEIPESELNSGYQAEKSKKAVGMTPWHSGPVNALLPKDRQRSVMLSRWRKAVRVVPDSEVAESIAKQLKGTDLAIPWNVVTPNQLEELVKLGVPITTVQTGKQSKETVDKFQEQKAELQKKYPDAKFVDVQMTQEAYKKWGKKTNVKARIGSATIGLKAAKDKVVELFNKAKSGEFNGKPQSIGTLTQEGKKFLEDLSGLKMKDKIDFVLNPSDLKHMNKDHFGDNEKDPGRNIPLTEEDLRSMVDVIMNPEQVVYGIEKMDNRKAFFFLKQAEDGTLNLAEIYSDKKGNLTAKSYYKTKKGVDQRVMEIKNSLLPTPEASSGSPLSDGKGINFFSIEQEKTAENADNERKIADSVVNTANKLGGAEATVYSSLDDVPEEYRSEVEQGAKGWYDPETHTVHVYLPNCEDGNDAQRTVLHEKIGHEGMEVLLGGEDEVRKFANFVYNSVAASTRGKILEIANEYDPDWKNPDRMNVGTQEYIAHLAEEGPKTAEDFTLLTKIKHYLIKVLKKLGIRVPGLLNDKDLRYYLMKAGKALHVWDNMPKEKQEAMMKQASNAEIKDSLGDGADLPSEEDNKPKKKTERGRIDEATGAFKLAPNGEQSNLSKKQYIEARTKNFKDWFGGDWEKKPKDFNNKLDANGEPLEKYVEGYLNRPKKPTMPKKRNGEDEDTFFGRKMLYSQALEDWPKTEEDWKKRIDEFDENTLAAITPPDEEAIREKYQKQYENDMASWRKDHPNIEEGEERPQKIPDMRDYQSIKDYGEALGKHEIWKTAPNKDEYDRMAEDEIISKVALMDAVQHPFSEYARLKAMKAEFQHMRHVMQNQKVYDQNTTDAVVQFAKRFMSLGYGDDLGRGSINTLLTIVKNSTGKKSYEISQQLYQVMDVLMNNQLRNFDRAVMKTMSIKELKENAKGIQVQGKLELRGQTTIKAFRDAVSSRISSDKLDEKISNLIDKMAADKKNASSYQDELLGLNLAKQYVDYIDSSRNDAIEIEDMKRMEIEGYKNRKGIYEGELTKALRQEHVERLNQYDEALFNNKVERMERYSQLLANLGGMIDESVKGAREFQERDARRAIKVKMMASADLGDKSMNQHHKENWKTRLSNSDVARLFCSPLGSFDALMREFGSKQINGEGQLWNHFVRGAMKASNDSFKSVREANNEIDLKVSELFGKVTEDKDGNKKGNMILNDLYALERSNKVKSLDVTIRDIEGEQTYKLQQGNLMYIYMVNKMPDGAMKLRQMGILDADVERIKENIDPRFLKLADWIQGEFLPKMRTKYNKRHEELFGAPMPMVENYFPLRVLKNARYMEEDVNNTSDGSNALPSTATGAIIKRKTNKLPLDILNADALSVTIDNIKEMENWYNYAPIRKDANTLLSDTAFRNRVQNMTTIYGSGERLWNNVKDATAVAMGTYRPKGGTDLAVSIKNIGKGITGAKISGRLYTAFKQILSFPLFLADADLGRFAWYSANPYGSFKWAIENMPNFDKRWSGRKLGDTVLMDDPTDWKLWHTNLMEKAAYYGMTPNALVDAVTCAVGARAVFDTKYKQYIRAGLTEERAKEKALSDAEINFNTSQQSSEGAFVSPMQLDRTLESAIFTPFRNSSMLYERKGINALRNLKHRFEKGHKEASIKYMAAQLMEEGVEYEQATKAAEKMYQKGLMHNIADAIVSLWLGPIIWNLGGSLGYLIPYLGDDENKKKKMVLDAVILGLLEGPVDGLAGGQFINTAIANTITSDGISLKGLKNVDFSGMPMLSDFSSMIEKFGYDKVAGVQDLMFMVMQSSTGFNPKTLTDAINACIDYGHGDMTNAKEIALFVFRLMNGPAATVDNLYIDELGMKGKDAKKLSYEELAKRYAEYKFGKNTFGLGKLYSDEEKQKKLKAIEKSFDKKVSERLAGMDREDLKNEFSESRSQKEKKLIGKIIADELETKDSEAVKKAKADASYLRQRNFSDLMDDLYLQKEWETTNAANAGLEELKGNGASEEEIEAYKTKHKADLDKRKAIQKARKEMQKKKADISSDNDEATMAEIRKLRDSILKTVRQTKK